ncbi:MAG: membrane protein insertase YidC, partial [Deltaproteobacteria bacterium]|nr:membrane protein insertase YidC [Deltaproteobacteria bacterium]
HLSETSAKAVLTHTLLLGPGQGQDFRFSAYLGPKLYDMLVSKNMGLEEAIEFGMVDFMAKPLLVVLNFFERFLANYALAIILLTCIIKVAFHPLTKQSLNSMKEMQKISPQVMAVRQKYKGDKEKMNKELMELYKRYKINPLAGCLPIIVQIPVFIALYEVLSVAIELRHAPFMLWIADLSAKDPLYITPILMGGTMFIQQKMTPTTMDPAQAKIMLFMPAIFTVMFLNFPSGLVLYWLVNNIITITQQYYIHKGIK